MDTHIPIPFTPHSTFSLFFSSVFFEFSWYLIQINLSKLLTKHFSRRRFYAMSAWRMIPLIILLFTEFSSGCMNVLIVLGYYFLYLSKESGDFLSFITGDRTCFNIGFITVSRRFTFGEDIFYTLPQPISPYNNLWEYFLHMYTSFE